jgi:hypothetical protein
MTTQLTNQTPEEAAIEFCQRTGLMQNILLTGDGIYQKDFVVLTEIIQAQRAAAVAEALQWRSVNTLPDDDTLVETLHLTHGRLLLASEPDPANSIYIQMPKFSGSLKFWRPATPLPQPPHVVKAHLPPPAP